MAHAPRLSLLGLLGLGALTASAAHSAPPPPPRPTAIPVVAIPVAPTAATATLAPPSASVLVPFTPQTQAPPPRYAALPRVPPAPPLTLASKPAEIATGARAEGVELLSITPPATQVRPSPKAVALRKNRASRSFQRSQVTVAPAVASPSQVEIKGSLDSCVTVQLPGRDSMATTSIILADEGVVPLRVETLRRETGGVFLDQIDAWVDTRSHGAILASRRRVPLALVGLGPYGAEAFGYVEQGAEGELVRVLMLTHQIATIEEGAPTEHQINCSLASASLRRQKGGTTALGSLQREVMIRSTPGEDPTSTSYRVGFSLSLSQFSADPDPVLGVTLRAVDEPPLGIPIGRPLLSPPG